jgi:hypothetical protein
MTPPPPPSRRWQRAQPAEARKVEEQEADAPVLEGPEIVSLEEADRRMMSIFRSAVFCLALTKGDFAALPLIGYGAIRVRVTNANLEGEAEWTLLLGHHALCRSCEL